jgi:hypothetical protein
MIFNHNLTVYEKKVNELKKQSYTPIVKDWVTDKNLKFKHGYSCRVQLAYL